MIWIYLSHILSSNKFTGIVRTEYELARYARKLQKKQYPIHFCRFDQKNGFSAVAQDSVELALLRFQQKPDDSNRLNTQPPAQTKLQKRLARANNSLQKRLHMLKRACGLLSHPFSDGDTLISVGQDMGCGDVLDLRSIKQKVKISVQVMNHDIIPITHPQFVNLNSRKFTRYMDNTIQVTDEFWCNSEFTRSELQKYISAKGLSPVPMNVVNLGCDIAELSALPAISPQIKAVLEKPYLLYVSTIEIRKNHQLLYDAYLKLLEMNTPNPPNIVFVGVKGWLVDGLIHKLDHDERVRDRIIILNKINDDELMALYKNCLFTVYPSLMEGYGLPLAESLSLGKYCISANTGSLPEVGRNFVEYCNPNNPQEWAERIAFLSSHPGYLHEKEHFIQTNYHPTSWEDMATKMLNHSLSKSIRYV